MVESPLPLSLLVRSWIVEALEESDLLYHVDLIDGYFVDEATRIRMLQDACLLYHQEGGKEVGLAEKK